MTFSHADKLIMYYDHEEQRLVVDDVWSDGSTTLFTYLELAEMKNIDIGEVCHALGKGLLTRLPSTREELFTKPRLERERLQNKE